MTNVNYKNFFSTLFANYELRITNREYAYNVAAALWMLAYSRVEIYQVGATRRIGNISFWNPLANSVYERI